ncbi:hypothetical protein PsorP6_003443 [Peronosclerospora sorghi]|uniref:Uncharacterized protein n=1 Tax=Peronosclerospora sorghi TaxID=230839 RepID=A0ACC0VIT3_9STRA|nr:hypothetical protein PsorP6_003443 [Peronosclerospora sorghi]
MKNSAELLEKFQRGRRRLRGSILAVLLIDEMTENLDEDEKQELEKGKGFISKSDLARVSERFGKHMSESELNEILVGASGDPEQNESSVEAIDSEVAAQALLCRARFRLDNEKFDAAEEDYKKY